MKPKKKTNQVNGAFGDVFVQKVDHLVDNIMGYFTQSLYKLRKLSDWPRRTRYPYNTRKNNHLPTYDDVLYRDPTRTNSFFDLVLSTPRRYHLSFSPKPTLVFNALKFRTDLY
jgi:hypothetical protein